MILEDSHDKSSLVMTLNVLPLTVDLIVDLVVIWWHVRHLLALHLEILGYPLCFKLNIEAAVEEVEVWTMPLITENLLDAGEVGDGILKGVSVTLGEENNFLQEITGTWTEDTEDSLRGVKEIWGEPRLLLLIKFEAMMK